MNQNGGAESLYCKLNDLFRNGMVSLISEDSYFSVTVKYESFTSARQLFDLVGIFGCSFDDVSIDGWESGGCGTCGNGKSRFTEFTVRKAAV